MPPTRSNRDACSTGWGTHGFHKGSFRAKLSRSPELMLPAANLTRSWDAPRSLTAGLSADGTILSGPSAEARLSKVAAATSREGHEARGLLLMASTRQAANEFAAAAEMYSLSGPALRLSSMLLISNNDAHNVSTLLSWLRFFQAPPLELRMLIRMKLNVGYLCGNLLALAASVRIWAHFPWVLATSGPDSMLTPYGAGLLRRLVPQTNAASTAAYLGDFFTGPSSWVVKLHGKDPQRWPPTMYPEEAYRRYSMDVFAFWPERYLVHGEQEVSSLWRNATRWCLFGFGPCDRQMPRLPYVGRTDSPIPESLLNELRKRSNLTFEVVPAGSRGTPSPDQKRTLAAPMSRTAYAWHSHNSSAVFQWVYRQRMRKAARTSARPSTRRAVGAETGGSQLS